MSNLDEIEWELLIVDNNSSDQTWKIAQDYIRQHSSRDIRYIFEPKQGHSFARNTGVRESKGELLAFTDDDVEVDRNWISSIKSTFEQINCDGLGGKIIPKWGTVQRPKWLQVSGPFRLYSAVLSFDLGTELVPLRTPAFGANMAFARGLFSKYGLFRTDLGRNGENLIGGEDTEFGRRILRAGATLVYQPNAIVYHPVEETRISKRYYQSWYFDYGRASVRINPISQDAKYWLGIPRFLIKILLMRLLKWHLSFTSARRFYYKLRSFESLGEIIEARRNFAILSGPVLQESMKKDPD